jgi:hypothetical protein
MTESLVSKIATENMESRAIRQQLQSKLTTLEKGMEICQRNSIHQITVRKPLSQPDFEDDTDHEFTDTEVNDGASTNVSQKSEIEDVALPPTPPPPIKETKITADDMFSSSRPKAKSKKKVSRRSVDNDG